MSTKATCDLHTHTRYSDARPSPDELVRYAASMGLTTIAITDHDNARGSREAEPVAREVGINLIPAVELTTRWKGHGWPPWGNSVDVLGYFIDSRLPAFRALEEELLAGYHAWIGEACEDMTRRGYPITLEEAFTENPHYVSSFTVISALSHKGLVDDEEKVYRLFDECWLAACRIVLPIDRAIETIHLTGGVAVLAHPVLVVDSDGNWLTDKGVAELVEMGLDGIEIYHYRLADEKTRQYFLGLARRFDLAISGGSDEHGWPSGFPRLGQQPVTEDMVAALRARKRSLAGQ